MGAYAQIAVLIYAVMRRTPVAGIWEYIVSLLYLPVFTIWVSVTKQAFHTLELFITWVSAAKQASHTLKLFIAWVSAAKQASHTHKLFTLRRKKGTENRVCPLDAQYKVKSKNRDL